MHLSFYESYSLFPDLHVSPSDSLCLMCQQPSARVPASFPIEFIWFCFPSVPSSLPLVFSPVRFLVKMYLYSSCPRFPSCPSVCLADTGVYNVVCSPLCIFPIGGSVDDGTHKAQCTFFSLLFFRTSGYATSHFQDCSKAYLEGP